MNTTTTSESVSMRDLIRDIIKEAQVVLFDPGNTDVMRAWHGLQTALFSRECLVDINQGERREALYYLDSITSGIVMDEPTTSDIESLKLMANELTEKDMSMNNMEKGDIQIISRSCDLLSFIVRMFEEQCKTSPFTSPQLNN